MRAALQIETTPATLGATVTGVKLASLSPKDWSQIRTAFLEHAVLVFPGQHLSDREQAAFGGRFGELVVTLLEFSNEMSDGSLRSADDPMMQLLKGNEGWHTDNSYLPVSASASMLSARTVPSAGGDTEWADMRAAYQALTPKMRTRIEGLKAYHSLTRSQVRTGQGASETARAFATLTSRDSSPRRPGAGAAPGTSAGSDPAASDSVLNVPPPLRPLVKRHPETGRPALYIGRHAYRIEGLGLAESEGLLTELLDFACHPPRVLTHTWEVGDFVIWDNRCVLHRVRPWDLAEARTVVHTRVNGDPVSEAAELSPPRDAEVDESTV